MQRTEGAAGILVHISHDNSVLTGQVVAIDSRGDCAGLLQSFCGRFLRRPHLALEVIAEHVDARVLVAVNCKLQAVTAEDTAVRSRHQIEDMRDEVCHVVAGEAANIDSARVIGTVNGDIFAVRRGGDTAVENAQHLHAFDFDCAKNVRVDKVHYQRGIHALLVAEILEAG